MKRTGIGFSKIKIAASVFAAAFVIALVCLLPGCSKAGAGKITELSCDPFGSGECSIRAEAASANEYRLFLPGGTDFSSAKIYFEADSQVRLQKREITTGSVCSAVKGEGEYELSAGSTEYTLSVYVGSDIPSLFITTESGSLDNIHANKENKEKGSIRIAENGVVTLDTELKSIKGRGNSSWLTEKKSYNIKFDEKQSLFGMDPAKKWSLVACTGDAALLKCQLGFELAQYMGVYCACEYSPAELYINGEYRGLFLVCESVEIGEGRVDITDLEKLNEKANPDTDIEKCAPCGDAVSETPGSRKWADIPASPKDITGGYLLEFDGKEGYAEETSAFISPNGQYVVVKEPEYCSEDELNYIADWYALAEEALISDDGYNSLGKHYSEYFDIDSLARMYIFQEYIQNTDASFSSCFFYKDKGDGKLYAGPAWDFDSSMNLECKIAGNSTLYCDRWFVNNFAAASSLIPSVYNYLFRQDDFAASVTEQWKEFTENALPIYASETIDNISAKTEKSIVTDKIKWNGGELRDAYDGFAAEQKAVGDFFEKRTAALEKGFGDDCAMLYYDPNGGSGFLYTNFIVSIGEKYNIMAPKVGQYGIKPPDGDHIFEYWNTEKDGSGTSFYPGDELTAAARKTVLYAQWKQVHGE